MQPLICTKAKPSNQQKVARAITAGSIEVSAIYPSIHCHLSPGLESLHHCLDVLLLDGLGQHHIRALRLEELLVLRLRVACYADDQPPVAALANAPNSLRAVLQVEANGRVRGGEGRDKVRDQSHLKSVPQLPPVVIVTGYANACTAGWLAEEPNIKFGRVRFCGE